MNNFCTCGTGGNDDFDAGDCDNYWICESAIVPEGTKCCECGAAIPAGGRRSCATHYEVYEPKEPEPTDPYDVEDDASITEEQFVAIESAFENFRKAHGWDDETERYVRETSTDFRCDRCEGEVEILAQFDVCVSSPGELPGAHEAHYWHQHKRRIRWRTGTGGVLNPQPWRLSDYVRHYRRKAYWRLHSELTWKLKWRVRRWVGWYKIEHLLLEAVYREKWRCLRWKRQMEVAMSVFVLDARKRPLMPAVSTYRRRRASCMASTRSTAPS